MATKKTELKKFDVGRTLNTGVQPITRTPQQLPPASKKRSVFKKILFVFILLLIFPLYIAIWNAKNYSAASQKIFGTSDLSALLSSTELKGSSRQRVNIMLVGYSADDPGHAGSELTDSIMIISLSKVNPTGYMLSIPRDLYVAIPGYGMAKINEAYQQGEIAQFALAGYSNGGMGLLEKTIYDSLGITVDYNALINYSAVRESTDALGGITVNIQSADPRGIHDPNFKPTEGGPLTMPNGVQKIDGQTALRLTRARGSTAGSYGFAQSDFDRTKNQQAVIKGIRQAINWKLLLDPRKNNKILDAAANNISTNVQINEALPLFKLFRRIPEPNMKSVTLRDFDGHNLLDGYWTPYGQSALIPAAGINDFSQIRSAITALNQQ